MSTWPGRLVARFGSTERGLRSGVVSEVVGEGCVMYLDHGLFGGGRRVCLSMGFLTLI